MPGSTEGLFVNRRDAGIRLAAKLLHYRGRRDVIVLALPRGGVPVAFQVARKLHVPLDILLVRKLGAPGQEELAMGAIASFGVRVLNAEVVRALHIPELEIEAAAVRETLELERRERDYRGGRPAPDLHGRIVILVDDGLATGATMLAAITAARGEGAVKIVVAVPVAARRTLAELKREVEEVACVEAPAVFDSVGQWYDYFSQTSDQEVRSLLTRNRSSGLNVTQVLQ